MGGVVGGRWLVAVARHVVVAAGPIAFDFPVASFASIAISPFSVTMALAFVSITVTDTFAPLVAIAFADDATNEALDFVQLVMEPFDFAAQALYLARRSGRNRAIGAVGSHIRPMSAFAAFTMGLRQSLGCFHQLPSLVV